MDRASVADGKDHLVPYYPVVPAVVKLSAVFCMLVTQLMQARLSMSVHVLVSTYPAIDLSDKLRNNQV